MKQLIILTVITLLMGSCNPKEPEPQASSTPGKSSGVPLSLETTREIKLAEGPQGYAPLFISSIQTYDDRLLIVDQFHSQRVYLYDLEGTQIKQIGSLGAGPGEYRLPGGACITDRNIHLAENGKRFHNIYDLDGNFIKAGRVPGQGIANSVYAASEGRSYFTSYSRYNEHSIFIMNEEGVLEKSFSAPDKEFGMVFDTYWPMGSLLVEKDRLLQTFNHRYEVVIWSREGEFKDRMKLASTLYVAPNYQKASRVRGHKEEQKYQATYTQISGLYSLGADYITVLRRWDKKMKKSTEVIEFWDDQFIGQGRYEVATGEDVVTTMGDQIIFKKDVDDGVVLIFRRIKNYPETSSVVLHGR